jgi:Fic family protein
MEIFNKIDALKKEIDALRPISADLEAKIMQKFRLDWNYNSNAIEGNRLTFGETKTFLLHGITADGKPLKDHLDIKGHNNALLLLEDIIHEERPITESFIRELHQMILQEDYYNDAITTTGEETRRLIKVGEYKQAPNHVKTTTGEIFRFASPEETPAEMDKLIQWLRSEIEKGDDEALHPVALAALFHYKFIRVHPFDDGNGRLARILMNMLLMRAGYPPSIIKAAEKESYYIALRKADGDDLNAFVEYVGTVLLDSMELYLKGAKGESIEDLNDFDKKLALFKKGLDAKKEKVKKSEDVLRKLYKEFVLEFIQDLKSFSLKFEDLFFRIDFLKDLKNNMLYDENFFYEKTGNGGKGYLFHQDIGLLIRLKEFKQKPSIDINVNVEFYFRIDHYKFFLSLDKKTPKLEITKEYNQTPKRDEWMSMIHKIGNQILEELKNELGD